jgi:FkbM family methyltransferase
MIKLILFFERVLKFLKTLRISNNDFWTVFNSTYSINSTEVAIGISHYCNDLETIIDVGANKGQFAVAIKKVYSGAQIYSFEPIEFEFQKLKKNLNGFKKVKIFNIALGSTISNEEFNLNEYSLSSSFLKITKEHTFDKPITSQTKQIEIEVSTLDYFVTNGLISIVGQTLLKLDVQGYERQVLEGAGKVLKEIDFIVLECSFLPLYESELLFQEMHDVLKGYGFSLKAPLSFWQRKDLKIIQTDILYERIRN